MNASDILRYEHNLKAAGVSNEQAEIHAKSLADLIDNNIATKKDLLHLKNELIIKVGVIMGVYSTIIIGFIAYIGH